MPRFYSCVRFFVFLFAALSISVSTYATHILAMDLYYTWVSGNTYTITVVIYGDCINQTSTAFGYLPGATPQVCVFRGNTYETTLTLSIQAPSNGVDITPVCPSQVGFTACEDPNSTIPGIMKFVYTANYTLPSPSNDLWVFGHFGDNVNSQSGRSLNVTNIVNPGTSTIQLLDTLDNRTIAHNSNAQFSVIPTPFFCLNMPDTYNPGAIDPDHDSLAVIDLIPASEGQLNCQFGPPVTYTGIAWNPPFTPVSATTPLNVVAGSYTYDVTSGQLNFTPNQLQRSTVVYNVREFRGGNFIGSSQREMNFLVQACTATTPTGGISGASNGIVVDSAHITTCANSGPFSFFFNPNEPGTTNNITVTSSGLPTGSMLTVTGNGTPTPHVTFSWTSNGVAPGTYIFYLTYTDNNCPLQGTNTTAISVTILPKSAVNYTIVAPITCAQKEAIRITPTGTGSPWTVKVTGTTPQTFTGVTGSFIDSLPSGRDTISIISSTPGACDSFAVIVIPSTLLTGDSVVCAGSSIFLSDALSGGTWSSSNTAIATVVASGTSSGKVTGVSGGIARITYSFPGGCFKTATVSVKPLPTTITGVMHVCAGSTTKLSDAVVGGTWSSASPGTATVTPTSGIVTGVTAGTVVITYTTGSTCSVTTTVTVNQIPNKITGDSTVCTGSTIRLSDTPTGGTWSNSNTFASVGSTTGIVTGIAAGTSTISYTLTGSCVVTRTVTVYKTPSAITGPTKVCTGSSIRLSDVPTGGTWSTRDTLKAIAGSTSGTITGVSAGIAVITYTTAGSCIATTSITVNTTPTVTAGSPNICTDGTTLLIASPGGGAWSVNNTSVATLTPSSTDDSATIAGIGISAGTTIVSYTLQGCLTTKTISTVHVLPPITGPNYVCTGQSITLSDAIIGGTWTSTNTSVATADVHAGVVVGISPGVPTISYTIGGSCITSTTITVRQSPEHGAITGLQNVCVGQMIVLSDTISGGVWTMSNDTATASHDTVTGVFPGRDTVFYIVHDAFCKDTASYPVRVYAVPIAGFISGLPTLCVGLTTILSDTASGGVWSSQTTTVATITQAALVTGVTAGNDSIKYTVTNPGCSSVATYTVSVYNVPVPGVILGPAKVCAGAIFTLSDTTGGVWNSSSTTVATINHTTGNVHALSTGNTTITYIIGPNEGRCFGDTTYTLTVTPQNTLTISSTVTQVTCYGASDASIAIVMSGGTPPVYYQYQWSNGDTIPTITGLAPGGDTLLVIEPSTLCQAFDTFRITQPDTLHVTDTVTQDICKQGNGTVTAIVTGGTWPYTFLWSDPGSTGTDSVLEHLHSGTYTVTVTDHNGCSQTITGQVTDNDCIINIHNVITPNGDGVNDTWIVEGIDNYPENTVQVFDKWGDMIYSKTNYNSDWNGKGKNGELPDGTYYYLIKLNAKNLLGNQNTWTGAILIKR